MAQPQEPAGAGEDRGDSALSALHVSILWQDQTPWLLTCEGTESWLGMGGHLAWPQKALGSSRQGWEGTV